MQLMTGIFPPYSNENCSARGGLSGGLLWFLRGCSRTDTKGGGAGSEVLTLSFEFADDYSQKRVLWRDMTPPDRHGSNPHPPSPKQFNDEKKRSLGSPCGREQAPRNATRQVAAAEDRSRRGSPFSLSPVSHPRRRIPPPHPPTPARLPLPPVFPLFQLRRAPG